MVKVKIVSTSTRDAHTISEILTRTDLIKLGVEVKKARTNGWSISTIKFTVPTKNGALTIINCLQKQTIHAFDYKIKGRDKEIF